MLVLPIINNKHVLNVEIRLKNTYKVKKRVSYDDAKESDIIVNREKFSDSSFSKSKDINAPVDFIRSRSILHPRKFLITTKEESDSSLYDIYEVPQPPEKINDNLDKLYSKAITDMRCEIPNNGRRGRYVSLKDLGVGDHLSDDRIALLQRVAKSGDGDLGTKLKESGIIDLALTADFLNNFECVVISDSEIAEESLQETLKAMAVINTRDYRNLNKYYEMAKSNTDIYTKISYINKIVHDRPLVLLKTNDNNKKLIKKKDNYGFRAAS